MSNKKEKDFSPAEKRQIRAEIMEHCNFIRAAREWQTTERVIKLIWGGQIL